VRDRTGEKLVERYSVSADKQNALRLERGSEGRDAGTRRSGATRTAPALGMAGCGRRKCSDKILTTLSIFTQRSEQEGRPPIARAQGSECKRKARLNAGLRLG